MSPVRLVVLVVLLLALQDACSAQQQQQQDGTAETAARWHSSNTAPAKSPAVLCTLHMYGPSSMAKLACTGGSIKAAVLDSALEQKLQAGGARGVTWGAADSCTLAGSCFLAICGIDSGAGSTIHLDINVQNVSSANAQNLWGVLCIGGTTVAAIQVCAGGPSKVCVVLCRTDERRILSTSSCSWGEPAAMADFFGE